MTRLHVRRRVASLFRRRIPEAVAVGQPGRLEPPPLPTEVEVIGYGPAGVETLTDPDLTTLQGRFPVVWVNVTGLADTEAITRINQALGVHRLAIEDILHAHQRPKTEDYDDHLFVVARTLESGERFDSSQVSLVIGAGFVATFTERPVAGLQSVRQRLQVETSRLRTSGPDYLAYAILDAVIDELFPPLEAYADRLEALEEEILVGAHQDAVGKIIDVKYNLLAARRALVPLREAVSDLLRADTPLLTDPTRINLRDCQDHTMQLIEMIESYQELGFGLMEVYLSSLSARTNQVMKVLTIMSSIFIPLTFIAGVYGMNFNAGKSPLNMPETQWYYGYPIVLGAMGLIAGALLLYFRRRGWLGEPPHPPETRPNGSR